MKNNGCLHPSSRRHCNLNPHKPPCRRPRPRRLQNPTNPHKPSPLRLSSQILRSQLSLLPPPPRFFQNLRNPHALSPPPSQTQTPLRRHLLLTNIIPRQRRPPVPYHSPLTASTWTVATVSAISHSLPQVLAAKICLLPLRTGRIVLNPNKTMSTALGPLFAVISQGGGGRAPGSTFTVIAERMATRWLEIYCGVVVIRVLLYWFPKVRWDRQPMSAI